MRKIFLFFCAAAILISCKRNVMPKDILGKPKMEAVLWDYISADIYIKNFIAKDTSKNIAAETYSVQEKVFEKNKTDRNTFNKSYAWYRDHNEIMQVILDSISAKQSRNLEKERSSRVKKIEQLQ